jgi:uncharacterized membrane-anchored protein
MAKCLATEVVPHQPAHVQGHAERLPRQQKEGTNAMTEPQFPGCHSQGCMHGLLLDTKGSV